MENLNSATRFVAGVVHVVGTPTWTTGSHVDPLSPSRIGSVLSIPCLTCHLKWLASNPDLKLLYRVLNNLQVLKPTITLRRWSEAAPPSRYRVDGGCRLGCDGPTVRYRLLHRPFVKRPT
jgi:hypothetical protein